jgi:hypothetical protein
MQAYVLCKKTDKNTKFLSNLKVKMKTNVRRRKNILLSLMYDV